MGSATKQILQNIHKIFNKYLYISIIITQSLEKKPREIYNHDTATLINIIIYFLAKDLQGQKFVHLKYVWSRRK